MNNLLWLLQILLAILFVVMGGVKFLMPSQDLAKGLPDYLPLWFIYFIGACEILGGIGLIVPWLTKIKPSLTPLAAIGLLIIMIGATVISAQMDIKGAPIPATVGLLCAFVAYGRMKVSPAK